jgi:hypothetical protein
MLFCTHFRAATWSFRPALPGAALSPVLRNPAGKQLHFDSIEVKHDFHKVLEEIKLSFRPTDAQLKPLLL